MREVSKMVGGGQETSYYIDKKMIFKKVCFKYNEK